MVIASGVSRTFTATCMEFIVKRNNGNGEHCSVYVAQETSDGFAVSKIKENENATLTISRSNGVITVTNSMNVYALISYILYS